MDEVLFSALCRGGPLDGQRISVRTGDGFLAADKANNKAWIYKRQPDNSYAVCTEHDDSLRYPSGVWSGERTLDPVRLQQAGETSALDIIAVDGDT